MRIISTLAWIMAGLWMLIVLGIGCPLIQPSRKDIADGSGDGPKTVGDILYGRP